MNSIAVCKHPDFAPEDYDYRTHVNTIVHELLVLGYNLSIVDDGLCILIQFDYKDEALAEKFNCWLDLKEVENLDDFRYARNNPEGTDHTEEF